MFPVLAMPQHEASRAHVGTRGTVETTFPKSPRRRPLPQFMGECRRATPRAAVAQRMRDGIPQQVQVMHRSEGEFRALWNTVDAGRKGSLNVAGVHQFLRDLGATTHGERETGAFVAHIASLRHPDMSTAKLPQNRLSLGEFIQNRAKLFATVQPSCIRRQQTHGHGRNVLQGQPPKKVAVALYGGNELDEQLSQEMLSRLKATIRCPGVGESSWKNYSAMKKDRGEKRAAPSVGLFPCSIHTHGFEDKDSISISKATWTKDAITRK